MYGINLTSSNKLTSTCDSNFIKCIQLGCVETVRIMTWRFLYIVYNFFYSQLVPMVVTMLDLLESGFITYFSFFICI